MKPGSALAIYFLFFVASAFILLPFGVKTDEEIGTKQLPGHAESAPHRFDAKRHFLKAAVMGGLLFALYYANWLYGWIQVEDLDFYH